MTLSDLTTPLTAEQFTALFYAELASRGIVTTNWKPGAVVRTLVAVFCAGLSALSGLSSLIAKSGFLSLAERDWLTLVARYVYGVERNTGGFASGNLTFANSSGFAYSGGAGDLIARNPTSLKTYRNTAAYTIGSGASNVLIPFAAIELGTDSTSNASAITELVTPLSGVTVTNPAALIGVDAEEDAPLRLRCSEKLGSLSPDGPRDAYAYLARTATLDGVSCGVTRVKTIADGIGGVDAYFANAAGTLTGTVGDLATNLGAVDEAIQTQCAPLAITARSHAATAKTIAVTYELWVRRTSLTDGQISAAVETALTDWLALVPIGGNVYGKVYTSALLTVIGAVREAEIIRVVMTVPAADVTIAATEAPVLGTVTVTAIHQIDDVVI